MNDTGERAATTIRPPASAELLIDSLDRYRLGRPDSAATITSSSDWQTNFNQIVLNGYFTRLAVTQIQFFWNLPTIITNYNDEFRIFVTGIGFFNITIPQSYYTPSALAAAIQVALQAAVPAANFVVTYSAINGGFRIAATAAGVTFFIVPGTTRTRVRCMETLGFLAAGQAAAAVFLGTPPTMLPTRFVDICSTYLTKYQRVKDSTTLKTPTITNVIARVYPTPPGQLFQSTPDYAGAMTDLPGNSIGSHPFTICIDYNTPKHIKWSPDEALSNFDLQLRDENGDLLPYSYYGNPYEANPAPPPASLATFTYGCEYQLTLLASES